MVFGKRGDAPQEELIGTLYSESPNEPATTAPAPGSPEHRREPTEGILDSHARFNGKFVSDRDLRIDGEAQGEIECQGTLIISPQARVRSGISAHNVIINGDYEGDVDCGGRFEIGSTGRVKGQVKTQVLVVKEGAHWEGSVVMTHEASAPRAAAPAQQASQSGKGQPAQPVSAGAASGQGSIFSKSEAAPSGDRTATGPGTGNNGQ